MSNQHNFIENNLIILTKQTLDIFLKQENPAELIALYTFYYYTAKWQETNQPKCTSEYIAKALHWKRNKVCRVKKQLLDFGLIEDVRAVDPATKKVTGYYVKMNYVFKKETIEKINNAQESHEKSQCIPNPPTGNEIHRASVSQTEGVAFGYTNALSASNKNALSTDISKKESKKERKIQNRAFSKPQRENIKSFNEIIDSYTKNQRLRDELKEHLKTRKQKKAALSNRAIELSLKKLDDLANNDEEKILMVQNAIMNGWTSFYPLKADEKKRLDKPSYDLSKYDDDFTTFSAAEESDYSDLSKYDDDFVKFGDDE